MKKSGYTTKARVMIMEFLEKNSEITIAVEDILKYLDKKDISVNFSTVYRYLNKLSLEKKVIKIRDEKTKKSMYQLSHHQHSCDEHLHIKCVNCGKLIHLNCGYINELKKHLLDDHGFVLKCTDSILYGVCIDCENVRKKNNL